MPKTEQQKRLYRDFVSNHRFHILLMYVVIPVLAVMLAFGFIRPSAVSKHGYWYTLAFVILALLITYAEAYIARSDSENTMNAIDRIFANENKDLVNRVDKMYQNHLKHDYVYYSMIAAIVCVVATLIALLLSVFIPALLSVAYWILDLAIVAIIVMFDLDTLY